MDLNTRSVPSTCFYRYSDYEPRKIDFYEINDLTFIRNKTAS